VRGAVRQAQSDMGEAGFFKTLWQAKKKEAKNKVGLSVIRELADTRSEFKASKGIIVTSTYLTKDALARIQRDKYILGKVDRDDLNEWIERTLLKYEE
jgi:restriction system protein